MTRPRMPATRRTISGKAVSRLRREGILPGVVYGHGEPSQSIQVDAREFDTLRRTAGRNALVDLALEGARPYPVMVHSIHEHPVNRRPIHVDFIVVRMDEEMTVDVQIALVGESAAVDRQGGTMLHLRDTLQIRALPGNIPQSLELDITPLEELDSMLHAGNVTLPADVTLVTDAMEAVVRVVAPRMEEEPVVAEAPEEAGDAVPEVGEEGADAAEDGAEG